MQFTNAHVQDCSSKRVQILCCRRLAQGRWRETRREDPVVVLEGVVGSDCSALVTWCREREDQLVGDELGHVRAALEREVSISVWALPI